MDDAPDTRTPEEILQEHGARNASGLPSREEKKAYMLALSRRSAAARAERRAQEEQDDQETIDEFNGDAAIDAAEDGVSRHVTEADEKAALAVLRKQLKSRDERVRQTAALKILEYRKGKPGQAPPPAERPQRIVLETAFALPDV